jgi:hypothetical protein
MRPEDLARDIEITWYAALKARKTLDDIRAMVAASRSHLERNWRVMKQPPTGAMPEYRDRRDALL